MRIFPSLGFLKRRCEKAYKVPDSDLVIEKDVNIIIPVQALQNDEKHFEEPEKFIPERFHPDNATFHKYTYLPFGLGPRACIGKILIILTVNLHATHKLNAAFIFLYCAMVFVCSATDRKLKKYSTNKAYTTLIFFCYLGERLGHMQSLAGLAALLSTFSLEPSKNSLRNPISNPAATVTQSILNGLPLKLVERKKTL